jgi:hypothetical protein
MSIGYVPRIASSKRNKKPNGTRMRKTEKYAGSGLGKKKSVRSCETKNQNKKKVKEMVFVLISLPY